jgi:hypothetical protein
LERRRAQVLENAAALKEAEEAGYKRAMAKRF